jgi:hypothetical protein
MKYKKYIPVIIFFLCVFICCQKLDVPPAGALDETTITNQKGVEGLLIGAYSLLDGFALDLGFENVGGSGSNWVFGGICGSEAYKGGYDASDLAENRITPLETFTATPQNIFVAQKWRTVYAGVQRANEVLRVMDKANDIESDDRERIGAEARFLRGFYHFEGIKVFNKVPYVDETVTYDNGNYYIDNDTLIWPAIENDFKYAMSILAQTQTAPGRANYFAAEACLAKAYMFQHKFSEARPLLEDLVNNGVTASGEKYALLDHYGDNFNPATKNSSESVFAAQTSVNDGADGWNGNAGDVLNFPSSSSGPGTCCGFYRPSQYLVNHFKTVPGTGLPDLDNSEDVKNDMGVPPDSPFVPYTGALDPRLDWTVGRRGIPYLDWGNHPGTSAPDWLTVPDYYGPYSPKKNIYSKSQQSSFTDVSFWTTGSTATNINLIRFADILLWAAEMEVEVGTLGKAEEYVNMVRNRAANPGVWVHTYEDDSDPSKGYTNIAAANYVIKPYPEDYFGSRDLAREAIRYERMLELGMEGHRFFDLVRWGIADVEINKYFEKEKVNHPYMNDAKFEKNKHEYFPIPQLQIDLSVDVNGVQHLKQNPGYN